MTKTRLLSILVIIMVVLNLIAISLLFLGRPGHGPHHRHSDIKRLISERLELSEEQTIAYNALIQEHRKAISALDDEMMAARNVLYSQLAKNETSAVDSQLVVIGQIQSKIESIHYQHFADIKALCSEEQLSAFNGLTADLATYFSIPKPPKKEH